MFCNMLKLVTEGFVIVATCSVSYVAIATYSYNVASIDVRFWVRLSIKLISALAS